MNTGPQGGSAMQRVEELANRVIGLLPEGAHAVGEDVRRNLRGALTAALARVELVTREEFDVQSAVLARTRAKLEALEKRVAELEAQAGRA